MTIQTLLTAVTALSLAAASLAPGQQAWVALSKVDGINAFKGKVGLFGVKGDLSSLSLTFQGTGSESFAVTDTKKEGGLLLIEIDFQPTAKSGYFAAELLVGRGADSQVVQIRGIASAGIAEGDEPALQTILNAVGAGLDAGGKDLKLPTNRATIGDSLSTSQFTAIAGETVRITPVARYSSKGEMPFGFTVTTGEEVEMIPLASLAETTDTHLDAHQTLRPPLSDGLTAVEVTETPARFGLFLQTPQSIALTLPGRAAGSAIRHTARIYPAARYAGTVLKNAYFVAFEQDSNGGYQDAVLLIEGVKAVK